MRVTVLAFLCLVGCVALAVWARHLQNFMHAYRQETASADDQQRYQVYGSLNFVRLLYTGAVILGLFFVVQVFLPR